MTLLVAESFDHWGDIYEKYTVVGTSYLSLDNSVTRLGAGQSFSNYHYNSGIIFGFTPKSEIYLGLAVYKNYHWSYNRALIFVNGNDDFNNFSIRGTNSVFQLYYNNFALSESSGGIQMPITAWCYYEFKLKVSSSTSAGDVQIRVNGELVYSCSAGLNLYNTQNSNTNIGSLGIYGSGCNGQAASKLYIDDLYICDSSGSTNNTFLGEPGIDTLYPNANGNSSDFMGSDGNQTDNYLLVDDAQETGDTDYVYDDTVDQIDLYGFDSVISGVSVYAVSAEICCRKNDAGSRTGRVMCRSGGTNYEGAEFFPSTDYQNFSQIWETDPNTASAWTETGVNGAEFGVTIES